MMKQDIINRILLDVHHLFDERQLLALRESLEFQMEDVELIQASDRSTLRQRENADLLNAYLSAKSIEGCSARTLAYYRSTLEKMLEARPKALAAFSTTDIRTYLTEYQEEHHLGKVSVDNMRRIFSSFFSWLEEEDYVVKSPVRRIHKVRSEKIVKDVLNDEALETLRDGCKHIRDLVIIDMLVSTGIRVGELVKINIADIDFNERQCVVLGKGSKERQVYFNARTKIHLEEYLQSRTDNNPALFVTLDEPHERLSISGVETRMRKLGESVNIPHVHPHKFRRTMATMAIDKGMPIEQVQLLLGHVKIDTTLHYAMVSQANVKNAHRKFIP